MQNIEIPYPDEGLVDRIRALAREADAAKRRAFEAQQNARNQIEASLLLRTDTAATILAAFKPPK
jgi:hypothetical protein